MPRGRSAPNDDFRQEGLQRVLLVGGVLVGLFAIAITAWGLAAENWALVAGPVLLVFAAACLVVSRDDGKGRWCPECATRNPVDAAVCQKCGQRLE
ncbi:MAG TPA: hypothetical protein VFV89_11820 [Nocardioides sp.]|uniref:hypothetical protein n=1 Tax=Nocardioides sp. TaxID=35761 RepID=UPI002E35209A|nr:hypothetical protein [Nocardioides sp.]HEX5088488.1 hypothetical protein [Nocardioides sp.]